MAPKNPLGYRYLLTWKQANQIFELTEKFVTTLPAKNPKTGQDLSDLIDHMLRSGRSIVRNIEEGYRRIRTEQYIDFLGFSAGSNEELLHDIEYCIKNNLGSQELARKILYLCKGEGKMLHNQVKGLDNKMLNGKTISQNEMAGRHLKDNQNREQKFDQWLDDVKNNPNTLNNPPKF